MMGLFVDEGHDDLARAAGFTQMARSRLLEVIVGGLLKPGADGLATVEPVHLCCVRGARDDEVGKHPDAGTESVLPVDPVAVCDVNEAPRDRGERRRLGRRPVVVDLPPSGSRRVLPDCPTRRHRLPEELRWSSTRTCASSTPGGRNASK